MAKKKEKKKVEITKLIEEEYITHNDQEDDEMFLLKEALQHALTPLERKIWITYLENETYAATAKLFKVSIPTLSRYINTLKDKILEYVHDNI